MTTVARKAYTVREAAAAVGFSEKTILRAIAAHDPTAFPPPLHAKNAGTDRKRNYRILATELDRWLDSLKDA